MNIEPLTTFSNDVITGSLAKLGTSVVDIQASVIHELVCKGASIKITR